jgi:hypothetical protein
VSEGDLNPYFGAISPDRGNHAVRIQDGMLVFKYFGRRPRPECRLLGNLVLAAPMRADPRITRPDRIDAPLQHSSCRWLCTRLLFTSLFRLPTLYFCLRNVVGPRPERSARSSANFRLGARRLWVPGVFLRSDCGRVGYCTRVAAVRRDSGNLGVCRPRSAITDDLRSASLYSQALP